MTDRLCPTPLGRILSRATALLLLITSPFLLGFGPPGITESDAALNPIYPNQLRLLGRDQPPPLTAKAALIMDAATGKVVWEWQAHLRLAPASLTKMMTAIVALEEGKPEDRVVVRNTSLPQEAAMGLSWGDVLSLEDLLWGLLLPSGNDAATVIADYIGGGSIENFVRMMNEKAAALGLKDTRFVNPHGLDEEGHYSSAYDLAVIGRYAMGKPLFAQMVGTESHVVRASRTFYLRNSNFLLRPQNRSIEADGIKTGYTDDAGDSIVASATRDAHRLIVVALGAADRTTEAIKLFNYAFANFQWADLSPPPYLVASDGSGRSRALGVKSPHHQLVPRWMVPQLVPVVKIKDGASLVQGSPVGSATYYNGGAVLAEVPLYLR